MIDAEKTIASGNGIRVYLLMALTAVLVIFFQYLHHPALFTDFFGRLSPSLTIVVVGLAGYLAFRYVLYRFGLFPGTRINREQWIFILTGTLVFGTIIIIIDLLVRFPADINVPIPKALLFYPVIGFFAEHMFHVLPLAILLPVFYAILKPSGREEI